MTLKDACLANLGDFFKSGKSQKPLFSSSNPWRRNRELWAQGVDMSAISPWNSYGASKRGGILIGKRHVLFAAHFPVPVGTTIRFISPASEVIDALVSRVVFHPLAGKGRSALFDMMIAELSAPVPSQIRPAPLVSVPAVQTCPPQAAPAGASIYNLRGIPVLATDAEEKLLLFEGLTVANFDAAPHGFPAGSRATTFTMASPVNQEWVKFTESVVGGDSGNPIFLVFDGALSLASVFTWPSGGTLVSSEAKFLADVGVTDVTFASPK